MYDLIVMGGGPAGSAAAITASRAGARVLLLERGRFPRHKVCGEFVSAESLGLLASLLDSSHTNLLDGALRISQARMFVDGKKLYTPVDPPAASIARFDLDAALWDSADKCGADVKQQTTVHAITGEGRLRVATSVGDFECSAVINTSGRWSNLTAMPAANGVSHDKWLGVKAHFLETNAAPSVDLYFFDGGYCGVQPVDPRMGSVNACAMVRADLASTLPEVFALHSELEKRSRDWQPLSDPVTTSPLIFRQPKPMQGKMLFAGDAAGFVDPFVGDGISLALRSGALAAECLTPFFKGAITLGNACEQYQRAYKERLEPVFRTSSKIRSMLRLPRPVRKPILFTLEFLPGITRYLVSKTR